MMLSRIGLPLLLAAGIMGIFAVGVLGHRTPKAPPTHPPAESAAAAEPAAIVPLDEEQAAALESELKAIERELDSLDLPSDKDFEGIESDLP